MSLELTAPHPTWAPRAWALRAQTAARRATVVIVLCVLNIQPGLLGTVSNKPLIILSGLLAIYLVSSTRSRWYARVPTHFAITLVLMIFLSVRVLADDRAMQTAHVGYMFITFFLAAAAVFAGEAVTISGNQRLALRVFVDLLALIA